MLLHNFRVKVFLYLFPLPLEIIASDTTSLHANKLFDLVPGGIVVHVLVRILVVSVVVLWCVSWCVLYDLFYVDTRAKSGNFVYLKSLNYYTVRTDTFSGMC